MSNHTDGWCGLTGVVQERVLVVWHDKEDVERYFGCLHEGEHEKEHDDADCEGDHGSEYAKCNGNLSLEIFQSDRTVMVNFHLPVKIGKTKYPRHMYIVIPTSALSMTRHVENTVPENIRNHLPQASSYNRIHLELSNSEEPYAVMPKVQRQPGQLGKRLTGIARQLIICLKSLCQAKSWDAFLVGNGTMQNQIDATCRLLDEGNVSGPPIDLGSIYNDGVYGCINSWHDYPYEESNCADPPPYHATAPRHPRSPNAASSKRSPSEDELYWKSSPDRYRPASSCEDDTVEAATSTKRKKGVDEEPDDDDGAATAHKHFRKAISSSNLKLSLTDSVAAWHQRLHARIDAAPASSPTQADTDSSAPFHDNVPPAEDPGVLADKVKVVIDNNSPSPDPTLPPTLQSAAATDVQPDCHAGDAELYFKMAEFLLYCLRIDPCAPTNDSALQLHPPLRLKTAAQ